MTDEAVGLGEAEDESSEDKAWDETAWPVRSPARWWGWAAFVLSLAGFGVSLYLTVEHFTGGILQCPSTGFVSRPLD